MIIYCDKCGNNEWRYVTEKKLISVGDKIITKEKEHRICTKCQTRLK